MVRRRRTYKRRSGVRRSRFSRYNKYRRAYHFRRRPWRKSRTQVYHCKFTRSEIKQYSLNASHYLPLTCYATQFDEYNYLNKNFEAYRLRKMRVRVVPLQNQSNRTNVVGNYVMAPYKKAVTKVKPVYDDFLSVDKAKVFRQTAVGSQIYNLSTQMAVEYSGGGVEKQSLCINKFMPRVETGHPGSGEVLHYGGLLIFGAASGAKETDVAQFQIYYDVYCSFYVQSTLTA